ncbi:MAG: hypothetical protein ACH37Z_01820 [Anaerolineae bacterium]|nr:hypothetical protein [Ardenticatenia bacterium]HQZ71833.1 hypothetical protein [Anaerolineae bacterium]HRA18816.1 hypothetical protein [Anaerolineae bacterium]
MPRLSVYLVRTALLHLLVGFGLGGLLLANKGLSFWPALWRLRPAHIELLLVGWTVQLTLGVAYWILPRFRGDRPRGDRRPVWAAYMLLNVGVIALALGPWTARAGELALAGRGAELAAVLLFAWNAWPRVKAAGG